MSDRGDGSQAARPEGGAPEPAAVTDAGDVPVRGMPQTAAAPPESPVAPAEPPAPAAKPEPPAPAASAEPPSPITPAEPPAPGAKPEPQAAATPGTEPVAEATRIAAAIEPASSDVAIAEEASPLPGVHRGGFLRLPTAPVSVTGASAPAEPGTADEQEPVVQWLMPEPALPRRGLAGWALAFSIAGLLFSLFVGWGFPIGIVAIVAAILALRRPIESRTIAVWALVLGIVSVLFSAGWLVFAASRANLFG